VLHGQPSPTAAPADPLNRVNPRSTVTAFLQACHQDDFTKAAAGLKSGQDVVFLVRQRGAGQQGGTIFLAGTLP